MSLDNTQPTTLENVMPFQDLSSKEAETVQGGAAMEMYEFYRVDPRNKLGSFNGGGLRTMSPRANDRLSFVRIREGVWTFYRFRYWINFPGATISLGYGDWNLASLGFDNSISSFRRTG
ncbi:MAG: hypothetical protein HY785_10060 [Oscillatoriophycideae cyanobacterium NC_groundwater_1537_Pr4_S-0.65um_50_18]|nr:hypothetical protein [Candidatus Woesearchaeota archaeon]MBI4781661.1 hypothetical protein [Oscillatoriophycideae cyanobacterium NC_groundwater_1537_Pr4_S-0.65um_50_18]